MKRKEMGVTLYSGDEAKDAIALTLQAPVPETVEEYVELCGGKTDAALGAAMSGWYVKAQSKIRVDLDKELESDDPPSDPAARAQEILDDFVYTGPREKKAKKPTRISKEALKEKGIKPAELKQMSKLLELLREKGVEVDV